MKFPVGGPRQPVYNAIRNYGFVMSKYSDKEWNSTEGLTLNLYGAGSMARITDNAGKLLIDAPLDESLMFAEHFKVKYFMLMKGISKALLKMGFEKTN